LHIPGQLAAYLVLPLDRLGLNLQGYLDGMNRAMLGVLEEFDLRGEARPEAPGIFLGPARVGTLGVAVNRWIAYHGLTLNVGPYLEWFEMLDEPGFGPDPLRQTSMEARRQRPAPMARVRETLIRRLETVFGLERHHVYTHHPLIRRKVRAHVYAQSPG
jgi:lipoate-protein ligase B